MKMRSMKPSVRKVVEEIVTGNPRRSSAHDKWKLQVQLKGEGKSSISVGSELLGEGKDYATFKNSDKSRILVKLIN